MTDIKLRSLEIVADFMQRARVEIVKEILTNIRDNPGTPTNFWISFYTQGKGVSLPQFLKTSEKDVTTIVLEHQFYDVLIFPDKFSVLLMFSGNPFTVEIPFNTVVRIQDYVNEIAMDLVPAPLEEPEEPETPEPTGAVVSLDAFRKK